MQYTLYITLQRPLSASQKSSSSRNTILKLMIVPYISSPPQIDMTIAVYGNNAQCASNAGNAAEC